MGDREHTGQKLPAVGINGDFIFSEQTGQPTADQSTPETLLLGGVHHAARAREGVGPLLLSLNYFAHVSEYPLALGTQSGTRIKYAGSGRKRDVLTTDLLSYNIVTRRNISNNNIIRAKRT